MKRLLYIMLFAITAPFVSSAQATEEAYSKKLNQLYRYTVPVIQPADLQTSMDEGKDILIFDTRSSAEYQVSHLPNAQFVNYDKFKKKEMESYDREAKVIVYCTVGYRSERIGEKLQKMGFKDVHNLYGGITEWVNQGHSVVDPEGKETVRVHTYSKDWGKWLRKGEKVW